VTGVQTCALPISIAERLKDRFRLLVSGDQTVLPRQRTLRALIDWSFELLSEPERALFRRLAVFAGGWTLEAAESVCADEALDPMDVLELLAQLVQKSLVVMEPGGGRYRMLETVRAYTGEKLAAGEGEAATKRRHVAHFVSFAEQARNHLVDSKRAEWLQLLDLERENLLSVHAWCRSDSPCRGDGLRLVFLLRAYWLARGLLTLGHRVTAEALAWTHASERTVQRCRALCDVGVLLYYMGRYSEAHQALVESHDIANELGDQARQSAVLPALGSVLAAMGDRSGAMAIHEAAAKIASQLGQLRQEAVAVNALAQLHRAMGDLDKARTLYLRAGSQFEILNDNDGIAITWLNLAMVEISAGEVAGAAGWLRRVNSAAPSLGSRQVMNCLLEVTSGLCAARGEANTSAYLLGAAEHRAQLSGIRREAEDEAFLAPLVETARRLLGNKPFEACVAEGRSAQDAEVSSALTAALAREGITPSE
jgi:non-specific serine/threonine protein kinase